MTVYAGAIVPASESAAGFGPYPRTLVPLDRAYPTQREAKAFLERYAITLRGALHDHETRFEAHVLDDGGRPVLFRVFGREEIHDEPWIGRAELGRLKAEHEARIVVPVVRRIAVGRFAAEVPLPLDHGVTVATLDVPSSPPRVEARALNGAALNGRRIG